MIILEMWTGSLYTLAPGDTIKVLSRDRKEKDGSIETVWNVVVQRSNKSIVYISKPYAKRVGAHTALNAIREEIRKKSGDGATHVYIRSLAYTEEEA